MQYKIKKDFFADLRFRFEAVSENRLAPPPQRN